MSRRAALVAIAILVGVRPLSAQESPGLREARAHLANLLYDSAVIVAQRALVAPRLPRDDRISLYELLGTAYAAMDSSARSVEAFKTLIFLAPDREPDPQRVSPRITSQYQVALGQSLVARHIRTDSATFVAGEGGSVIRFQVSRAALVRVRLAGASSVVIDSQPAVGEVTVRWDGMGASRTPAPPGTYQLIVQLIAGRDTIERGVDLRVSHAPLDTIEHLATLPGYAFQAETEQPQRSWAPLSVAASYVSIGLAAALALRNNSLGSGLPPGVVVVGTAGLASGFVLSLRKPPPRPVPAAVLYNRLLRDLLTRRNEEIASQNAARRQKVVVTIVQAPERSP